MGPVKILLVEDELLTVENIKAVLHERGYEVTASVISEMQALEAIKENMPDLILMDICLNGKVEGINIAKTISKQYAIPIIYITQIENEDIFQKAKMTFPQNYLSKPFSNEALLHAIELAVLHQERSPSHSNFDQIAYKVLDRLFVQTHEGFYKKLLLADILYIKADTAYSEIHFEANGKSSDSFYLISLSSNKLIARLGYPPLIKVHKSFHINIERLESIENASVSLKGANITIPIGRDFRNDFEDRLQFLKHNSVKK